MIFPENNVDPNNRIEIRFYQHGDIELFRNGVSVQTLKAPLVEIITETQFVKLLHSMV